MKLSKETKEKIKDLLNRVIAMKKETEELKLTIFDEEEKNSKNPTYEWSSRLSKTSNILKDAINELDGSSYHRFD
jgi:ssRNA-specific RNase YbeY (16S rRNA maturation enzyme)